ncbi:MAG: cytochrome c5 family protein [Saccharospirillaceae bacterium]|nr:c-type cytochrome [Pseudomonadales bacterium]NRB81284.1 cytochrome c5 family protein [Saccharospirillaceae bacterium]
MKIANLVKYVLLTVLTSAGVLAFANEENSIESRLAPVGNVCIEGIECTTAVAVASPESDDNSPEALFKGKCNSCHGTGAGGAPIVGNTDAWAPRIAKGTESLYASALNGVAGTMMMPKGGFSDLADEDVQAIVDYMVEQSQ